MEITDEIVAKALNALKPDSSPGIDNMQPRILKELRQEISKPLGIIFRQSLNEGKVPQEWKKARITAIFKKGNKSLASNYRPVSLTSVVCKTMERILRDQITEHLVKNNLLSSKQFGFVPGRSTSLQLLRVLDEWTEAIDQGFGIDCVYMDYMKAFDTVPHKRLINKLTAYGIGTETVKWIENYLKDRKQQVSVNGEASIWHDVLSGIPQGSILGPTLFVIFINDLPEIVDSKVYLFADDTKI